MSPTRSGGFALALSLLLTVPLAVPALSTPSEDPESGARYVVRFQDALPEGLEAGDKFLGMEVLRVDETLRFAVVEVHGVTVLRGSDLAKHGVRGIEPDPVRPLVDLTPDDPHFGEQYGPHEVRAPKAWEQTLGDPDVRVCVVDTGIRSSHEDLEGSRWLGGHDFVNGDEDPWDDHGHGTHVAGIAVAATDNGRGIAGMAQVGFLAVKVMDASGRGALSDVASAIHWCSDHGADVVTLSLGASSGSGPLQDAVQHARSQGALVVAATGNGGCTDCVHYPAVYPEVVAVTCTDANRAACSFSSTGPESELAAPGEDVLSTLATADDAYGTLSGTSMSTPHVAGVAALVWSHAPHLTHEDVRRVLQETATDLGANGRDAAFGYGLVDAAAALQAAGGSAPPPTTEVTRLAQGFDDGAADGWTLNGLWRVGSDCAEAASEPGHLSYHRSGACDYDTGARTAGSASAPVNLSDATGARLQFQHRWQTESYSGGAYDVMRVDARTPGQSWTTLAQWDSRDPNQAAWSEATMPLDEFTGDVTEIRFRFDSIDGVENGYPGWFIDDVRVLADVPTEENGTSNRAPVADAGEDREIADADGTGKETVTLDGGASHDPDGRIDAYAWRLDGEVLATGENPSVDLPEGRHTITLTVTDDDGAHSNDTMTVTVTPNQAPTSDFTATCDGLRCRFDGTTSTDEDGHLVSHAWDLGDGTTLTGKTVEHTYADAGTYRVQLTVEDNGGATASRTEDVTAHAEEVAYRQTFENDAKGWSKSGGSTDLWRLAKDCSAPSGRQALAFARSSPDCDYDVGHARGWASSPVIDLGGRSEAFLEFRHWWETETASSAYDVLSVEVSSDAGRTWTTAASWDARHPEPGEWTNERIDVSAHTSAEFRFRFRFDSMDGYANDFAGWYVDDVAVMAS